MSGPAEPDVSAARQTLRALTGAASGALLPALAAIAVIVLLDAGAYAGTRVLGGDASDILYPWYVTALKTFWVNPAGVFDPYTLGGMPSFNFVANYDPIYALPLLAGGIPDVGQYQLLALSHAFLIPISLLSIGALRKLPPPAMWTLAALSVAAAYVGPVFKYAADTDGSDCYAWTFAALAAFEYYRVRGRPAYAIATVLCLDFAFVRFATGAVFLPLVFVPLVAYHWGELRARSTALRDLALALAAGVAVLLPNLVMQGKLYTIIQSTVNVAVVEEADRSDVFGLLGMRLEDAAFWPLHTMFAVPGALLALTLAALGSLRPRFRLLCAAVLGVLLLYALGHVTPFADLFRAVYVPAALFRRPYAALEVALPFAFYLIAAYGLEGAPAGRAVRLTVIGLTLCGLAGALFAYPQAWALDLVLAATTIVLVARPWGRRLLVGVLAVQWAILIGYPTLESVFYPQPRNPALEHFRSFRSLNAYLPPAGVRAAQAFRVVGIGVPSELGMYAGVYEYYSVGPSRGTRIPRRLAVRTGIAESDTPAIGPFFLAHPSLVGSAGMRAMAVRYYFVNPRYYDELAAVALRVHPELRAVPSDGYWRIIEDPYARPFVAGYAAASDVPLRLDGTLGWNGASFEVPAETDHVDLALLYDSWWSARTAGGVPLRVSSDEGQLRVDTSPAHGGRVVVAYGSAAFTATVWLALATYAALLGWVLYRACVRLRRGGAARLVARAAAAFAGRFAWHLAVALVAYAVSLALIFPHFVAPFAPFHSDMYVPANLAARGFTYEAALHGPRPLMWMTLLTAGRFGIEGSAAFLTLLTLADLALALTLLERYVLRRAVPVWVAFAAFAFAIAGPEFYFVAGYDGGATAAMLFGLLGVLCWEAGARDGRALLLTGACFTLSTLTKESFIPALLAYGIYAAWREPLPRLTRVAVMAVPLVAALLAFADGQLTKTPFVALHGSAQSPYAISFAPASIASLAGFYLGPLFAPAGLLVLVALFAGAWARGRLAVAGGLFAVAIALATPYMLLPNHRLEYYQWTPMPLVMLLVPLAWTPPASGSSAVAAAWRDRVRAATAVLVPLCLAVALIARAEDRTSGWWSLQQQAIDRSLLADLRSVGPEVRRSRTVLVCGLSFPFHPWSNAEAVTRDLGFHGEWTVADEPGFPPIDPQPHAQPIGYDAVRFTDYDLIVIFRADGTLAGAYRPEQLLAMAGKLGLGRASALDVVAAVRDGRIGAPAIATL
jgi:hypothetical protein